MRSHFGASSMCARAFRISSLRSPFARGMWDWGDARILPVTEHEAGKLDDRGHARIDIAHLAPERADPDRGHPEAVGGAQVVEGVVHEGAAVRVEVMVAQQHVEAVQRR